MMVLKRAVMYIFSFKKNVTILLIMVVVYMVHFYRVSKNTNQKDVAGTSIEKDELMKRIAK